MHLLLFIILTILLFSSKRFFTKAWMKSPRTFSSPSAAGFVSTIRRKQKPSRHPSFIVGFSDKKISFGRSSLSLSLYIWNVGDAVFVDKGTAPKTTSAGNSTIMLQNQQTMFGIIEEKRGGGWYAVHDPESNSTIKCRGNQLTLATQRNSGGSSGEQENYTTTHTTAFPTNTSSSIPPPPLFTPRAPHIIDLDALVGSHITNSVVDVTTASDLRSTTTTFTNDDDDEIFTRRNDPEFLQQVVHHSSVSKWVVFTDLHCAPATLETCLEVLDTIHRAALERQAGVLFLGDFWHHRGTIRVDLLNSVLNHFEKWQVPMIMIPGNHDQVTLSGHEHSLTPLQNSYRVVAQKLDNNHAATTATGSDNDASSRGGISSIPGPLIFSHPTKFANALFIPHVRDINTMESVLASSFAQEASAIFVHAEVTGASMNDLFVSQGGVPPRAFPPNKPIFSGHFHKPHVVNASSSSGPGAVSIEYLGSPYEVSLAEAQQTKALVVLDSHSDWACIERIPLSIGPRHFRLSSIEQLFTIKHDSLLDDNDRMGIDSVSTNTAGPAHGSSNGSGAQQGSCYVREGDRVVLSVNGKHLQEWRYTRAQNPDAVLDLDSHIEMLREGGVSVEIRESKQMPVEPVGWGTTAKDSSELELMSPDSTWKSYMKEEIRRDAITSEEGEVFLDAGLGIINELEESIEKDNNKMQSSSSSNSFATDLQLHSISVEGFGPFRDAITYPLFNRGLVLLRGTNKDGGSDSNGSGKSSLAMAALWALTGSLDPRPVQDFRTTDVVNDFASAARVTVNGAVNGVSFTVARTKTAKGKGGLVFVLGDRDLTTQSVKETTIIIEEKLCVSTDVLARTIFHGQHSVNQLLETSDSKLKDELSLVVPLSLWQSAASLARARGRTAAKEAMELSGMVALRSDDLTRLKSRLLDSETVLKSAGEDLQDAEDNLEQEMKKIDIVRDASDVSIRDNNNFDELQDKLNEATDRVNDLQSELSSLLKDRDEEMGSLQINARELSSSSESAKYRHQSNRLQFRSASHDVASAKEKVEHLEKKWSVDLSSGRRPVDFVVPNICPTCLQPVSGDEGLQAVAETDIDTALNDAAEARYKLADAAEAMESAYEEWADQEEKMKQINIALEKAASRWAEQIYEVEAEFMKMKDDQARCSDALSNAAKEIQSSAIIESLKSAIYAKTEAFRYSKIAYEELRTEIESTETVLKELNAETEAKTRYSNTMTSLADAFGIRGVQTFVLQNAVEALQLTSQTYLNDFSDGTLRIRLNLDAGDRIVRKAFVREPDGNYRERPLASLSGGQWRRCSLALTLGFAELMATRGRLRPSLCILDEPLTHLDRSGRVDAGRVLRKIVRPANNNNKEASGSTNDDKSSTRFGVSTMLVILQDLAAEELEEAFDHIDEVEKQGGTSIVNVDESVVNPEERQ